MKKNADRTAESSQEVQLHPHCKTSHMNTGTSQMPFHPHPQQMMGLHDSESSVVSTRNAQKALFHSPGEIPVAKSRVPNERPIYPHTESSQETSFYLSHESSVRNTFDPQEEPLYLHRDRTAVSNVNPQETPLYYGYSNF